MSGIVERRTAQPCDNPFSAHRVAGLSYVEQDHRLSEIAQRLRGLRYRGAIVGPTGSGKSALLQALGDELMDHGLTPLPLILDRERTKALPADWRRTVRKARPTDALLLDGFDTLPWWARLWVLAQSRKAGAVIVTSQRPLRMPTAARTHASSDLFVKLIEALDPAVVDHIDAQGLYRQSGGDLRLALSLAAGAYAERGPEPAIAKPKAANPAA